MSLLSSVVKNHLSSRLWRNLTWVLEISWVGRGRFLGLVPDFHYHRLARCTQPGPADHIKLIEKYRGLLCISTIIICTFSHVIISTSIPIWYVSSFHDCWVVLQLLQTITNYYGHLAGDSALRWLQSRTMQSADPRPWSCIPQLASIDNPDLPLTGYRSLQAEHQSLKRKTGRTVPGEGPYYLGRRFG